eukprot:1308583-Lingulodinium_polyedra.AAC.1
MVKWALDRWPDGDARGKRVFHSKAVLLTYQGNFGVVSLEPYKPLLCPETTIALLRSGPYVLTLWQDAQAF